MKLLQLQLAGVMMVLIFITKYPTKAVFYVYISEFVNKNKYINKFSQ